MGECLQVNVSCHKSLGDAAERHGQIKMSR